MPGRAVARRPPRREGGKGERGQEREGRVGASGKKAAELKE